MKLTIKILSVFLVLSVIACGGKEEKENGSLDEYQSTQGGSQTETASSGTSEADNMQNKGIGPVDNVDLPAEIDESMATRGADLFKNMCSACHKMDKTFIGPELAGVTERRTPEWIMNMILNPEQMIKEDPIAKKLLIESNMAVMADQNLEREEARRILEYFRQYDQNN